MKAEYSAFTAIGFVILALVAGTANARPDLSISNIRFNGGIYAGPCNQVVVTVRNSQMTGVSSPVTVELQLPSDPEVGNQVWLAELANGIGPNASLPVTFDKVMVIPYPGNVVRAIVDPANAIAETTIRNNMLTQDAVVSHGACPNVRISNAQGVEADRMTFQVSLDRTFVRPVTVRFRPINGTATGGRDCTVVGADFITPRNTLSASTLTFNPGTVGQQAHIQTCADDIRERQETFQVELYQSSNADIVSPGRATGTISDGPSSTR